MQRNKSMLKKKKKTQKVVAKENIYFDEELEPVEVQMIPDNQLELNDAELDEDFTKTLSSIDPNKPQKITTFNFKKGSFQSHPNEEHIAIHISHDGIIWSVKEEELLKKLKEENKQQQQQSNDDNDDNNEQNDEDNKEQNDDQKDDVNQDKDDQKDDDDQKAKSSSQSPTKQKSSSGNLVKNQFNFSERASQTFNQPLRDRECQTEPAPKSIFSQNANPATIRDEYLVNLLKLKQQKLEEENRKKKSQFGSSSNNNNDESDNNNNKNITQQSKLKHNNENDAILYSKEMLRALKIMERVTVLNAKSKSYENFRYYQASDYKKKPFLSHLWTFKYCGKYSGQMVTCLCWNTSYRDLFAVGYGSYNFNQQTSGKILIYSLKSTVYPSKIILCESGVMCIDFHPKYSSLICVGSYDGSVSVYDIRNRDDSPIYSSENPSSHHSDPVWDIKWYHTELQHELTFYSISSDSSIKFWKMTQNELNHDTIIQLTTPPPSSQITCNDNGNEQDDDATNPALCSCFDFSPFMDHLYLVGTEDGHIMECSKTSTDGYIKLYRNAHYMNVYCVKWNPFNPKIFLSCSEDWTVKLWDTSDEINDDNNNTTATAEPVITYDLGCSVNDICWSPYSSTIFGAVTSDGKVHIFDLSQNKNYPLCSFKIISSSKNNISLTKISFPCGYPIIIVGDEKGNVYSLKLSPSMYLNHIKFKDILKNPSINMFNNNEFKKKQKNILINVLNVTGNKVLDLNWHFSPQKFKSPFKSPKNSHSHSRKLIKIKSPTISSIAKLQ